MDPGWDPGAERGHQATAKVIGTEHLEYNGAATLAFTWDRRAQREMLMGVGG